MFIYHVVCCYVLCMGCAYFLSEFSAIDETSVVKIPCCNTLLNISYDADRLYRPASLQARSWSCRVPSNIAQSVHPSVRPFVRPYVSMKQLGNG
jgi:hypothetical protein